MKNISILVPYGANVSSVDGAHDILLEVNNFLSGNGEQLLDISLVSINPEVTLKDGLFQARTRSIEDDRDIDLLIIPAAYEHSIENTIQRNSVYFPWIAQKHESGTDVACFCVSAFLLASTGLLNGRRCATNWMVASEFQDMFPDVTLVTEKIMIDESGLYTSGGGYSYLNLMLYLVEKMAGWEAAVHCAKVYQIDMNRNSQVEFILFKGQKNHGDVLIRNVQDFIESNFRDKFKIEDLSEKFCLNRRSLELRFKKATGNTVIEYLQRVKVEAAKKNFENSQKNINEVMYDVGYLDVKSFREIFRKYTGLSPIQYREKYNKERRMI